MAQYNRPPKAKTARPDDFLSFFDHLTRYFLQHQMKLWILLAAALLAFLGYTAYRYLAGKKMQTLAMDYWKAEQADPAASLGAWQAISKLNPPKPLREIVDIQQGGAWMEQSNWKEAAQALTGPTTSKRFTLWSIAQLARATALENAGDYAKALAAYQAIADRQEDPFRFRARLGMARSYLGQGQAAEAEKLLFPLVVKGSDAPEFVQSAAWVQLATMKIPSKPIESAETRQ